jgi:hypothetical protein
VGIDRPSIQVPVDFTIIGITVEALATMENNNDNPFSISNSFIKVVFRDKS